MDVPPLTLSFFKHYQFFLNNHSWNILLIDDFEFLHQIASNTDNNLLVSNALRARKLLRNRVISTHPKLHGAFSDSTNFRWIVVNNK